jgi:hypothetical protein
MALLSPIDTSTRPLTGVQNSITVFFWFSRIIADIVVVASEAITLQIYVFFPFYPILFQTCFFM